MASGKTLELSRRDQITIAKSVTDLGLGEPQYIGTYRKVVESVGKDGALRLYSGISPEKSEFICSCGECGCIDDRNRQTQEEFCCVECHHSENADIHSAKNIKFRLTSTVLRGYLLERAGDDGYRHFQPKSLPRWQVRKCLEKCRCDGLFKRTIGNHERLTMSKFE